MGNQNSQPNQQYQYGKKSSNIRPRNVIPVQQQFISPNLRNTLYFQPQQQTPEINNQDLIYQNSTNIANNTTDIIPESNNENNDSSYKVLGFEENQKITQEELTKRYRSLALKFHPDRNKEPYAEYFFNLVQEAYKDLANKLKLSIGDDQKYQEAENTPLPDILPEREEINKGFSNIKLNPENFDIDQFNTAFDEFRCSSSSHSNPYSKGYADQMEKSSKQRQNSYAVERISNSADFNRTFDKNKSNKQIQIYKEPEPIVVNPALNFTELGQENVNNFGAKINNSLHATDYMDAHVNENTLIDPKKIGITRPESMNQLKNTRSQINYNMSARDKAFYEMKQKEEEQSELERRERLKKQDAQQEKDFYLFNRMFIK
jgi:curved DNA-binding protein CbpA